MTDPPRDAPPPVYRLARAFGRFVLWIYFRKIEIEGAGQLRAPGPAIFAANHPQSITDPLVLGLGTPRMVHFVAHSGLFRNPLRRALLRGAGVVPVFRPHESEGAAEENLTMFRACGEVLVRGGVIGIFPEGTSRDERRVERLKTGTARIALETEAAHDFQLGVRVVPVGIHFETPRRFRSHVLLRVGTPLVPRKYASLYQDDPRRAVESFTRDLFDTLAAHVVHVERAEQGSLVESIEQVYREELLARPELLLPDGSRLLREAILAGEIAKAVGYFETRNSGELAPLAEELEEYRRRLHRARIPEALLRPRSLPSARRTALRSVVPLAVRLPLAAWGTL
jgi:1-acyl-sn-glycerol-3-phosphate acyltransferase